MTVDVTLEDRTPNDAETLPDTDAILDRLQISARRAKDTIRITGGTSPHDREWWQWLRTKTTAVYVDLKIPTPVKADVHVPGGSVKARDVEGTFRFSGVNGTVQSHQLEGTLKVQSRSSDVVVDAFSGDDLSVRAVAGSVSVSDVHADTISMYAASGPVSIDEADGEMNLEAHASPVTLANFSGSCVAHSNGAPITFRGAVTNETQLATVGAPITARISATTAARLSMTGGRMELDESLPFEGTRDQKTVTGTLNGGGPSLQLRAVRGSVRCEQV